MSKKEEIYEFFNKNLEWDRQRAIKQAMKEFEVTETTAITYYQAWRKEYMKPGPKPATYTNNSIKVAIGNAVEKAGIKTTIPLKKEEKVITTVEPKEEITTKETNAIKLIPVMFKGPVFTFSINANGIEIIDGKSDKVTEDIIKEQQEALRIYKDLYGIGYKKESELI